MRNRREHEQASKQVNRNRRDYEQTPQAGRQIDKTLIDQCIHPNDLRVGCVWLSCLLSESVSG